MTARRVIDVEVCAASRASYAAELEGIAVARLRVLAAVFGVLALVLLAVFAAIDRGALVAPPGLVTRPGLEAIVLACLAEEPAARTQSAAELAARLAAAPVAAWTAGDADAWWQTWQTHVPEMLVRAGLGRRGIRPPPAIAPRAPPVVAAVGM